MVRSTRKQKQKRKLKKFLESLKKFFRAFDKGMKEDSTSFIQKELEEYENVFALLTTGVFAGVPSPPTGLVLRILPYMQLEISIMVKRSAGLEDVFGEMMGTFDID